MNGFKKLPAVIRLPQAIGFIALAAAAFVILYLVLGVEPAPEPLPPQETSPKLIEPAAQSAALEVLMVPEPKPKVVKAPSPPLKAIHVIKDDQPPPLKITTPRDRSYVMARLLPIRARSEAGARMEVNGNPLTEISVGVFSGTVKLKPGENQLSFSAQDAVGNTSAATLQVTYVEPKRIRRVRTRFTSLLNQLEEVRSTAEEIDHRTEVIISRIEDMQNAETINRLSKELREIRNTRRELQKEIGKAIREIDGLLEKHQ